MEQVIGVLVRIRDELDALIVGLDARSAPGPVVVDLRESDCQHEHTQEIQGAGPCPVRKVCVDCGKEL